MSTLGDIGPAGSNRLAALAAHPAAAGSGGRFAGTHDRSGVSLYVHVPFCASKCAYCDFCSLPIRDERWHEAFLDGVLREARHWRAWTLDDVPTLYIGGGTPTVLGERLVTLVRSLVPLLGVREGAEVTVEANPDSVTPELVAELAQAGVNRFSLGVQSFDDEVLRTLGRRHDADTAERAARVLAEAGMRLSVDLMCGIPGQSLSSWRESLSRAVATGAGHVSAYPLSVEEGTPLYVRVRRGEIAPPDPDRAAHMMTAAEDVLGEAGLLRYEVASYARRGEESRHNTRYWTGGPYVGIGPSGSSMLPWEAFAPIAAGEGWDLPEDVPSRPARARFTRSHDVETYVYRPVAAPAETEVLSESEAVREDVMLGLRLVAGAPEGQVAEADLSAVLETLAAEGLAELAEGRWRTTRRGWLLGNEVFGRVWNAEV